FCRRWRECHWHRGKIRRSAFARARLHLCQTTGTPLRRQSVASDPTPSLLTATIPLVSSQTSSRDIRGPGAVARARLRDGGRLGAEAVWKGSPHARYPNHKSRGGWDGKTA